MWIVNTANSTEGMIYLTTNRQTHEKKIQHEN